MTDNRDRDPMTDTPLGDEAGADAGRRDTETTAYPAMPPLANADPDVRGEDEPTDTGWAGAARAAEGEVVEEPDES